MTDITLTAADLLTVAGAGAAAMVVAQFAKMLFTLAARWVRTVAMVTGLAIVLVVTIFTTQWSVITLIMACIVGMQAGLAASAVADVSSSGLDYRVHSAPDTD